MYDTGRQICLMFQGCPPAASRALARGWTQRCAAPWCCQRRLLRFICIKPMEHSGYISNLEGAAAIFTLGPAVNVFFMLHWGDLM